MRPEVAYRIVTREMDKFCRSGITVDEGILMIQSLKVNRKFRVALDKMLDRQVQYAREDGYELNEMYRDVTHIDDILYTLFYISDRWNCYGRIMFIKRIIGE